jgi:REP element-mobilizing transposase RayT
MFMAKPSASREIYGVEIHGYVLMPNHFHLIVSTPKANLPQFMRHFNISYTAAFNRRHNRVGHLYQGRYKAILVDADSYLLELSRYLHVNPVRVRLHAARSLPEQVKFLERYPWSSLSGYLSSKRKLPWVNYDAVLGYLGGSRKRYAEFLAEGIRRGYDTPWEKLQGQVVLGEDDFVERVKGKLDGRGSKLEQPALRRFQAADPRSVIRVVARHFKLDEGKLAGRRTGYRTERAMAMELMYRYAGVTQEEIGKALGGLDYSAVSRERKQLRENVHKHQKVRVAFDKLMAEFMS